MNTLQEFMALLAGRFNNAAQYEQKKGENLT